MGLSRTFQNTRLFAGLSVLDNVKVGLDQAGRYNLFEAMFLLPRRQREERRIAEEARAARAQGPGGVSSAPGIHSPAGQRR